MGAGSRVTLLAAAGRPVPRAKQALAAARELARLSGEPLATREWNPTQGRPLAELVAGGQAPDTILVGHVLNELWSGEGQAARRAALLQEARDPGREVVGG